MLGAQLHLWCMDRLGAPSDHADKMRPMRTSPVILVVEVLSQ